MIRGMNDDTATMLRHVRAEISDAHVPASYTCFIEDCLHSLDCSKIAGVDQSRVGWMMIYRALADEFDSARAV